MNLCPFPKEQKYVLASGWSLQFLVASLCLVVLERVNTVVLFCSLDVHIGLEVGNGVHSITCGTVCKTLRGGPLFTPSSFLLQANILRTPSVLPYQPLFRLLLPHLPPAQFLNFLHGSDRAPFLHEASPDQLSFSEFLQSLGTLVLFPNFLSVSGSVHYLFYWL